MRRPRGWTPRIGALVTILATAYVVATLLDFEPDPLALALVVSLVLGCAWLVLDTLDAGAATWRTGVPDERPRQREDRLLVAHHRMIEGHLAAREPSPALADALIRLALLRDPALARPGPRAVVDELDPPAGSTRRPTRAARLRPEDVDRLLSRIEEP